MSIEVAWQSVHIGARLPTKAYGYDAGWDLYSAEDVRIEPSGVAKVPLGLQIAIPSGYYGHVHSRSSTYWNRRLDVRPSIMDAGYRGDWYVIVRNMRVHHWQTVAMGERIAQLLILPVPEAVWREMDELPAGEREANGFGSSGA